MSQSRRIPYARSSRLALVAALCLVALGSQAAFARGKGQRSPLSLSDRARAQLSQTAKREAIAKYGVKAMALKRTFLAKHNTDYSVVIPRGRTPYEIRNQRQSGRCWLYAFDNVLQSKLALKGVRPRDLSTSFMNYHALRTQAFALLKEAASSRALPDLARIGELDEGGHQPWARAIVRKHGIVPERVMRSTYDGNNSALTINKLRQLIVAAYREIGKQSADKAGERASKAIAKSYQKKIEKLLDSTIGKPPRQFTIDGVRYTPKTYLSRKLKISDADLDYVVLLHDPERGFNRGYVQGGDLGLKDFVAYNVSMATMQAAVKSTIKGGESVWFSANAASGNPHRAGVSSAEPREARGVLAIGAFDYEPYIPSPKMSKRERQQAMINLSDHAMALTAFDPKAGSRGTVLKWRVDNSWGRQKAGKDGHFHMYDDYFRHYVDSVVVPRSALSKAMLTKLNAKPIVGLEPAVKLAKKPAAKWRAPERRKLVLQVIAGALSVDEAAHQHGLKASTVQRWHDNALQAMNDALRSD
ncbi:MAG: hypothetical protein KC503_23420 [Myxococcales bacterium]|nr:hypothetical protein [Myxococcales bacterium]